MRPTACTVRGDGASLLTERCVRRNASGIAGCELLYPWHPWAGCLVHIHEVVEKADREVFRCSLSGQASGRRLEIPAWMFDRAAGAAWRVGAAPYVDIAVLTALATLLQDVTSVSAAPSQLRDSSAAMGAHDTGVCPIGHKVRWSDTFGGFASVEAFAGGTCLRRGNRSNLRQP